MTELERSTMARVTWRLLPFLLLLYIISWLDRVNVGFAKLQMNADLGLSDTAYGFGAGIFFLAYAACEIPSNLLLVRFGARRWIARIMITWGLISAGMMFVQGELSFYVDAPGCSAPPKRASSPASSTTSASGFRARNAPAPCPGS